MSYIYTDEYGYAEREIEQNWAAAYAKRLSEALETKQDADKSELMQEIAAANDASDDAKTAAQNVSKKITDITTFSSNPVQIGTWANGTPVWRISFQKQYNDNEQYGSLNDTVLLLDLSDFVIRTDICFISNRSLITFGGNIHDYCDENYIRSVYGVDTYCLGGTGVEMSGVDLDALRSDIEGETYQGYVDIVTAATNIKEAETDDND